MSSYGYQYERPKASDAPYATDTSPRHGRRASNLGAGLHQEQQGYGHGAAGAQLGKAAGSDYGFGYGNSEAYGRVTTNWAAGQASSPVPGLLYHPPPSPGPLPPSELDPQGIMRGRMRTQPSENTGLQWTLPSSKPKGQSVPINLITGEPLEHIAAAAARAPASSSYGSRRTGSSSGAAAAPPPVGSASATASNGSYSMMYSQQQQQRRTSAERAGQPGSILAAAGAGPSYSSGGSGSGYGAGRRTGSAGGYYDTFPGQQQLSSSGDSAARSAQLHWDLKGPPKTMPAPHSDAPEPQQRSKAGSSAAAAPAARRAAAATGARPQWNDSQDSEVDYLASQVATIAAPRRAPAAPAARPPWNDSLDADADSAAARAATAAPSGRCKAAASAQQYGGNPRDDGASSSYSTDDDGQRARSAPGAPRAASIQRLKQLSTQRLVQRLHSPTSSTSSEPLDATYTPSAAAKPLRQLPPAAARPAARPEWLDEDPFGGAAGRQQRSSRPPWQDAQPDSLQQPQQPPARGRQPAPTTAAQLRSTCDDDDSPAWQPPAAKAATRKPPPAAGNSRWDDDSSAAFGQPLPAKPAARKPPPAAASRWDDDESAAFGQPPGKLASRQPPPAASRRPTSGSAAQQQLPSMAAGQPMDELAGAELPKIECPSCGRSFIEAAYEKHSRICAKVFGQKRKAFDMSAKRTEGLQQEGDGGSGARRGGRPGGGGRAGAGGKRQAAAAAPARRGTYEDMPAQGAAAKLPKWRQQSEALKAAMRANRQIAAAQARGEDIRSLALASGPALPDDRVPCPHCGRRYAAEVAERHVPKCKDIVAKPGFLKGNAGKGAYARSGGGGGRR